MIRTGCYIVFTIPLELSDAKKERELFGRTIHLLFGQDKVLRLTINGT